MSLSAKISNAAPSDRQAFEIVQALAVKALDRKSGPLYRQIADILRAPMETGSLRPGQPLPREADLAETFGVSLITVRQALRELESEGRIRKQSAKPTIVTTPPPKLNTSFNFESLEAIIESTAGRHIEILDYCEVRSPLAQKTFDLGADVLTYRLEATLLGLERPVAHGVFFFAPEIGQRLKREDFDDVVVFRSVQSHLGLELSGAKVSVRSEVADEKLAKILDYDIGGPIMTLEIVYFNTLGEPVQLTINRNRADMFSLQFDAPYG